MSKKKVYAVAAGYKPGIYDNWPEAEKQVVGFKGARYKGFTDREEALTWLNDPQYRKATSQKDNTSKAVESADAFLPRDGEISIYTDGGCSNNPGPGGYGAILIVNGQEREISGGFKLTTNNRMELMACIVALRALTDTNLPVRLYSDSSYVVNGISKGWAKNWRRRGWIKSDKQPAINPDLWGELLDLVEGKDIAFQWVRGHVGHPFNERCDQLAGAAFRANDLPVDGGYLLP